MQWYHWQEIRHRSRNTEWQSAEPCN